jgi:cell division protein FtsA
MNSTPNNHFIGLDVGTSAVRCVVGMLDVNDEGKLSIIGHGSAPNSGMRKGTVVQVEETADAIIKAVTEAERISGVEINQATVNVNGAHVAGTNSKGVIAVNAANRDISPDDRRRVDEAATVVKFPPNREILQFFAKSYSLDGQHNIKDPVGMQGVRLEVEAQIVTAVTPNVRNLDTALTKAGIGVRNHTVSSLASAEATLSRQQKEAGTLVLDIGAGTTNFIVVEDGEVQHVAVLPIGGTHLTNDLAIGLKTDLDIAEQVKLQHASLLDTKKVTASVHLHNRSHNFDVETIKMICESRVEELFEYVEKELQRIHKANKLPGGVVLTGGTAKLPGIADYARDYLQLAARVGKIHNVTGLVDTVEDVSFTTAVGLMMLDMLLPTEDMLLNQPDSKTAGSLKNLIKKFGL